MLYWFYDRIMDIWVLLMRVLRSLRTTHKATQLRFTYIICAPEFILMNSYFDSKQLPVIQIKPTAHKETVNELGVVLLLSPCNLEPILIKEKGIGEFPRQEGKKYNPSGIPSRGFLHVKETSVPTEKRRALANAETSHATFSAGIETFHFSSISLDRIRNEERFRHFSYSCRSC